MISTEKEILFLTSFALGLSSTHLNMNEVSKAARLLGARGGRKKTPMKSEAARKNGKLGGRPKKQASAQR